MKQLKILKDETNRNNRDSNILKHQFSKISFKAQNEIHINSKIHRFKDISKNIINKANDLINKNDKILDLNKSYEQQEESIKIEPELHKRKAKDTFITDLEFERNTKIEENYEEIDHPKENYYIKQDNFKNILDEIKNAKKQIQSEYDELNYLKKYLQDTKTSMKRHIYGIKTVIKKVESNIYHNPVNKLVNSFEGKAIKENKIIDKNIQISKISNNLFGTKNNVIGFNKTLCQNILEKETRNKLTNKITRYNIF